jgi:hypothetical protein
MLIQPALPEWENNEHNKRIHPPPAVDVKA